MLIITVDDKRFNVPTGNNMRKRHYDTQIIMLQNEMFTTTDTKGELVYCLNEWLRGNKTEENFRNIHWFLLNFGTLVRKTQRFNRHINDFVTL
jgi:hypothetical protein